MKKNYTHKLSLFVLGVLAMAKLSGQQSFTFTPCGATGGIGPTQTQANNTYTGGNSLNGSVTVTGGIQQFTVPTTGIWRIETRGARGYNPSGFGGRGAIMIGEVNLNSGDVLKIVVGQEGQINPALGTAQYGGGGGTYVVRLNNTPLVVAGGGGATWALSYTGLSNGTVAINGNAGIPGGIGTLFGAGGVNGAGGGTGGSANAGGGFTTNGGGTYGGAAFLNGSLGGNYNLAYANGGIGGFGGGGGTQSYNNRRTGGGGGYSGGGAAENNADYPQAGGGGSYNSGANQVNLSGANTFSDGLVIITEACNIKVMSSTSGTNNPSTLCSGNSLTLTTTAVSGYSWSNGSTASSIVVAPTTNTMYSVSGTSSLNCTAVGVMSINVSSGLPVLSISNPSNNICLGKNVILTASGASSYTWTNAGVVNGQTFAPTSTAVYTVTGQNGCGNVTATTTITVAPLAVSVLASPTIVCQGYATTLTASSAVSNYTWEPGTQPGSLVVVSPVANTIYTVSASDGTCSGTATISINIKQTPTITTAAPVYSICQGESVMINASGAGTGGTYSWSPGGSGPSITLSPSTSTAVSVVGTNSLNCSAIGQAIVLVDSSPPMTVVANKTLVCIQSSVILTAAGAGSYAWTGGPTTAVYSVTPTAAVTIYTVVGSHSTNTCTTTRTITVISLIPNVTVSSTVSICDGATATITASGANNYVWNGVNTGTLGNYQTNPQATSVYTLVATTSSLNVNCPKTYTIQVTVNANPQVSVTATRPGICSGETNTLTATGASTYSWEPASGTTGVVVITPTASTIYTVTGYDANGCENITYISAKVSTCLGIDGIASTQRLSVYPNPSAGEFIVITTSDIILKVVNSIGQEVRILNLNTGNDHKAQVKDLSSGVYFIVGENAEGKVNQKIIITK